MNLDLLSVITPEKALHYMNSCEEAFEAEVQEAVKRIVNRGARVVTLSGPTCSGKTTLASRLVDGLSAFDKRAVIISIDDFYLSREEMARLNITDFEGPSALDLEYFKRVSSELYNEKAAFIPKYSFVEKKRVELAPFFPQSDDIYIFEGIQAVYPEIRSCLKDFDSISLFVCVNDDLTVDRTKFSAEEIRLMRRCVRDYHHRDTSLKETMYIWENVLKNEVANIFPAVESDTLRIDSLIPYEIFIIGREFLTLSENYPKDDKFFSVVQGLRKRLYVIMDDNFSVEYVREDSLLRELLQ